MVFAAELKIVVASTVDFELFGVLSFAVFGGVGDLVVFAAELNTVVASTADLLLPDLPEDFELLGVLDFAVFVLLFSVLPVLAVFAAELNVGEADDLLDFALLLLFDDLGLAELFPDLLDFAVFP